MLVQDVLRFYNAINKWIPLASAVTTGIMGVLLALFLIWVLETMIFVSSRPWSCEQYSQHVMPIIMAGILGSVCGYYATSNLRKGHALARQMENALATLNSAQPTILVIDTYGGLINRDEMLSYDRDVANSTHAELARLGVTNLPKHDKHIIVENFVGNIVALANRFCEVAPKSRCAIIINRYHDEASRNHGFKYAVIDRGGNSVLKSCEKFTIKPCDYDTAGEIIAHTVIAQLKTSVRLESFGKLTDW